MKLSNIRKLGRYRHSSTGQIVNIHTGRHKQRSTDHMFYLYMNKRIFITDADFYSQWIKQPD